MKNINCLIVDDEELARNLVANYIDRLPYLKIVGQSGNPLEAMVILQQQKVDLIFLDIQMPELTGIEFLKTLPSKPLVIFTTAYKDYALQGFNLDVIDYLLKPFRFERFLQAINKVSNILVEEESNSVLLSNSYQNSTKNYLMIKADSRQYKIEYKDIFYIEGMKEYVGYHTTEGKKLSLESLKNLEIKLPEKDFVRVHKSYIVNIRHIKAIESNLLYVGDKQIPIGMSYKGSFFKKI